MTTPRADAGGPTAAARAHSTALLTIDLGALRANYRALKKMAAGAACSAVIKADAYGLGAIEVAEALAVEGCGTFFIATLEEARALRAAGRTETLYVLDGLFADSAAAFAEADARPCLGSVSEIEDWAAFCAHRDRPLPAAVHMDTGMNRLGLEPAQVVSLAARPDLFDAFELALVMSHLACADEPDHPKNEAQRAAFERLRALLPSAPASLANSAGTLLGAAYHYDLVRPGIALYGGNPLAAGPNPMRPVVRLDGRIAQIRMAEPGETVGYGATRTLKRRTRIATVTVGYADGFFRLLGSSDNHDGAVAFLGDHAAPLLGRVSMDLISIDVTDVPQALARRGAFVELLGAHVSVDDLAAKAQTIGYEILTSLGRRHQRHYIGR